MQRRELMPTINGNKVAEAAGRSLMEYLKSIGINTSYVAIELNGVILHRNEYDSVMLKAEDVVEVVNFVGGG
jgi:sulfur carrier protein